MKRSIAPIVVTLTAIFVGCSSFPITFVKGRSWVGEGMDAPVRIALSYPEVERQSSASSIEEDLTRLAPLLFLEHGLPIAVGEDGATAVAELHAVEREYTSGWKTRRCTTLELILTRPAVGDAAGSSTLIAASRASSQGDVSLASAKDLYKLLDKAVRELSDALREETSRNSRDER